MASEKIEWHALEVEEVFSRLQTSAEGLSGEEARRRLDSYGKNDLGKEQGISPARIILAQIMSPLIYVLFVAAVISFAAGHRLDAFVILWIVVLNTLMGFIQEYRAERSIEALRQMAAPTALVRRGGQQLQTPASDIVPGDIVILAAGDRVPADGRIIVSGSAKADEASLTGESVPADKHTEKLPAETALAERDNMVYAATALTYGRAEAVVTATGLDTEVGKIAREVSAATSEPTPLQQRLASVGHTLAILALGLSLLVFVAGLIRGINIVVMFLFAVASAVSTIPEGLPAVVTIVLAIGLQRMAARHAIIRKLPAVETLGSATVICSDKTGTLTKNEMTVTAVYVYGQEYNVTGQGYDLTGEITVNGETMQPSEHPDLSLVLKAAAICNDADIRCEDSKCRISGDPTEAALLAVAGKAGYVKEELSRSMSRVAEIPFDSRLAYMATLNEQDDQRIIFVKGAPERVIEMCSHVNRNGQTVEMTPEHREAIVEENHHLASRALRVLALAYKEVGKDKSELSPDDISEGLVFVGLAGMIDPPRPEAIEAIRRSKAAGIRVMMATGDHKTTARAIAEQMGILRPDGEVVDGLELSRMTDEELENRIDSIDVFARVEPEHKLRIVKALKRRGEIVAMTGDGVNDAPALKRADIGIAMGITGTDVSKEASEMVLTDDNFASIVGAVEEGRIIFNNITKVVTYLLSTNAGEVLTILVTVLSGLPLPLIPVQILWVNLVTDSFPALALAADPAHEDVLAEPPRSATTRIISRQVLIRLALVATIMMLGTVGLFFWSLRQYGLDEARTIAFATMVMFQFFNALNMRSPTASVFKIGLFTNKWLIGAIVVGLLLQMAAIHAGFMQPLFRTVPLSVGEWATVVAVASTVLWAGEIRKAIARRKVD